MTFYQGEAMPFYSSAFGMEKQILGLDVATK